MGRDGEIKNVLNNCLVLQEVLSTPAQHVLYS